MLLLAGGVIALWTVASLMVLGLTTAAARGDRNDRARVAAARAAAECTTQGRLGVALLPAPHAEGRRRAATRATALPRGTARRRLA